ncbi:SDR family NAD(P)-dependent oxidoreductase [Streptomyces canus]|uniref:SDR family NAD(P)-dependent oxidoreductase n=1 Tax=Streptomyces canus TaxID=58343 RepID=UPI003244A362
MATALVTGASHGIGTDIARALAARGHDLVLTARAGEDLGQLADRLAVEHGVTARALPADLTLQADLERVAEEAQGADILVNNAGAGLGQSFERTTWAQEQHMLALNVLAPARLLHAALPMMLQRGRGRILNVSSVAAAGPVWQGTTYGASKAFALAMTESLAYSRRLRTSPVALTALVLGHTVSRFHEVAGIAPSPRLLTLSSAYVARRAVQVIHRRRPPAAYVPSLRYKLLSGLVRHLPRPLFVLPGLADDFTALSYQEPGPDVASQSGGGDGECGVVPAETGGNRQRQP